MDEIRKRKKQKALDKLLLLIMNLPLSENKKIELLDDIRELIVALTDHNAK